MLGCRAPIRNVSGHSPLVGAVVWRIPRCPSICATTRRYSGKTNSSRAWQRYLCPKTLAVPYTWESRGTCRKQLSASIANRHSANIAGQLQGLTWHIFRIRSGLEAVRKLHHIYSQRLGLLLFNFVPLLERACAAYYEWMAADGTVGALVR